MYSIATFTHRLKAILEQRGMTQRMLAEELNTTEATVSRYASGVRSPNIEIAVEIARILRVDVDTLLGTDLASEALYPPELQILMSCYKSASDADKDVIWTLLSRYMSPEQRAVITGIYQDKKTAAM